MVGPRISILCLIIWACSSRVWSTERSIPSVILSGVRREPVAAVFWDDTLAAIACAKSGSLIIWNFERREIVQEFQVGKQLRGVSRWKDDQLLLIDDKTQELIQLQYSKAKLTELKRIALPSYPVNLVAWTTRNGPHGAVASLWSRQLTLWHEVDGELQPKCKPIDLPMEPRQVLPYANFRNLIVVPAFGGDVVEVKPDKDLTVDPWPGNAFGAAAVHDLQIFGTRSTLNQALPLTFENVSSGNIMRNELQVSGGKQVPLDREDLQGLHNNRNADPAGIAFLKEGILVCLAGTDEVWYRRSLVEGNPHRLTVGKRPRTIIARGDIALVLGELDDTVTLVDFPPGAIVATTIGSLDRTLANRELSPAERGERLFFSAKMSAGGMMTCNSCHPDGHTNGMLADTLGDNSHGTPKRVLTLRGTRLTDLWAWNGEMKTLQDNVHKSLRETMHAPEIKPADVDDIVSFLHTLPPVPPLKPVTQDPADRASVSRGEKVFLREGCSNCHVPPLTFTSHGVFDVGLADEKGLKKFNPPSLRGVGRLRKLFHDNRADSLRDVFETHGHQLAAPLPEADLTDLVRYLQSL